MPRNEDYLRTWRSINEAGGPTEPVRSHRRVDEEPRLVSTKGKRQKPLLDSTSEPLTETSLPSFVKNRFPMGDVAMGELDIASSGETDPAVSWYSSKENRIASGLALLNKLRDKYPDVNSNMRRVIEEAHENYPRVFAHLGDINEDIPKGIKAIGYSRIERDPESALFQHKKGKPGIPVSKFDITNTEPLVNKLKPSREQYLVNQTLPRESLLTNAINLDPRFLKDKDFKQVEETMREELGHTGQTIRRPFESRKDITEGRGQLLGLHGIPDNLRPTMKHLDYMLEPVEVGGKYGKERGLSRRKIKSTILANLPKEEIKKMESGLEPWPKDIKATSPRPAKSHAEHINEQLDILTNNFKKALGYAKDEAMENNVYSASIGAITGKKKVYPAKSEFPALESKARSKALEKIRDQVLPKFNRARPTDDPMVFTLRDKPINIDHIVKNPESLGDLIREIRVKRASQSRK